jgi:type IV secretory pathway component VirB8
LNPFQNADFSGKKREKWAFSAHRRDVGEKNRRKQKGAIFLIIIGVYVNALIKIYAKILLPQKSNRPYLLLIISNSGR